MTYATNVPLVRLIFSDGFKYYGAGSTVTVTATVNTPVSSVTHTNGETLTDGQVLPAQAVTDFHVPATRGNGWRAPDGSHINGWSYDVAVTVTATGQPALVWTASINPRRDPETITPGMGKLTGGEDGGTASPVSVTETAPGEYSIGA